MAKPPIVWTELPPSLMDVEDLWRAVGLGRVILHGADSKLHRVVMTKDASDQLKIAAEADHIVSVPFLLGTLVRIDGSDIRACIEGFLVRPGGYVQAQVSWLANGENKEAWINVDRLEPV